MTDSVQLSLLQEVVVTVVTSVVREDAEDDDVEVSLVFVDSMDLLDVMDAFGKDVAEADGLEEDDVMEQYADEISELGTACTLEIVSENKLDTVLDVLEDTEVNNELKGQYVVVLVMTEVSHVKELQDVVVTTKVLVDDDGTNDGIVIADEAVEGTDETNLETGQTTLGKMSFGKFSTVVVIPLE